MNTEIENAGRKKLLIVDDSAEIREGLKRFVSEIDSIELVGESGDGISALEMIDKLKPDFVTLDIIMPGMNGLLALTEIKKKYPSVVVLMLTNFPFEKYKKVCSNSGADYFFDKSNEFEEMIDLLKSLTNSAIPN
jgi:DNA-binding NarL/FixJ family response regulator